MGETLYQTLSQKTFITSVVCGFRGSDIYSDIIFGICRAFTPGVQFFIKFCSAIAEIMQLQYNAQKSKYGKPKFERILLKNDSDVTFIYPRMQKTDFSNFSSTIHTYGWVTQSLSTSF